MYDIYSFLNNLISYNNAILNFFFFYKLFAILYLYKAFRNVQFLIISYRNKYDYISH